MTKPKPIPFNLPRITGREEVHLQQVLQTKKLQGDGPFSQKCCTWIEEKHQIHKAIFTPSGTAAMEMAAILCDIQPGDEVILPSFTFVSTANAFVLRGAIPVWCDIRPDTLNIDQRLIERLITPKTRAIVPVHYAGVACEMDTILEIARRHGLLVIEDAAQCVCSSYKDRPLGSIGHMGCFSFHETKNIGCGEGGALLINDQRFVQRAEIVRDKGTNRSLFCRGQVDKYTWVDIGSSYLPSELDAAFLLAQLEASEEITAKRLDAWGEYHRLLEPLEQQEKLVRPTIPQECQHNAHLYYVLLQNEDIRNRVLQRLNEKQIQATFHYVPLHSSPMGVKWGQAESPLPCTDDLSARLMRLPLYYDLDHADMKRVVAELSSALLNVCSHALRG